VNSTASNTTASSFQFNNQSPFACPGTLPARFAQGTGVDFFSGRKRQDTEMNKSKLGQQRNNSNNQNRTSGFGTMSTSISTSTSSSNESSVSIITV
jgi:hypothetical protein